MVKLWKERLTDSDSNPILSDGPALVKENQAFEVEFARQFAGFLTSMVDGC